MLSGLLVAAALSACGEDRTPETPANQRYGYGGTDQVVLQWEPSPGADHYVVYHSNSFDSGCRLDSGRPSGCVELAGDITWTDFTHFTPDLSNDAHYYWVVACNKAGCSPFTDVVTLH